MAEISLEEIIREAKKRKIDLGADPEKTIKSCSRLGLIPKPKRKKFTEAGVTKTRLVFPEATIDKLAHIKSMKSEGLTLEESRTASRSNTSRGR